MLADFGWATMAASKFATQGVPNKLHIVCQMAAHDVARATIASNVT